METKLESHIEFLEKHSNDTCDWRAEAQSFLEDEQEVDE
jgi:hypothetical protein